MQGWAAYLTDIARRLGPYFARAETPRRVRRTRGLLSPAERKNSWQMAEVSGQPHPMAPSICRAGLTVRPMRCVTSCASTLVNSWAIPTR